jgi:hypothetical protein
LSYNKNSERGLYVPEFFDFPCLKGFKMTPKRIVMSVVLVVLYYVAGIKLAPYILGQASDNIDLPESAQIVSLYSEPALETIRIKAGRPSLVSGDRYNPPRLVVVRNAERVLNETQTFGPRDLCRLEDGGTTRPIGKDSQGEEVFHYQPPSFGARILSCPAGTLFSYQPAYIPSYSF